MALKQYFGPGFDLAKLAPAYATNGTMIAVEANAGPVAPHADTHAPDGSDPIVPVEHAATHGIPTEGLPAYDAITSLYIVEAQSLRSRPYAVGFGASVVLDPTLSNDFYLTELTDDCSITWGPSFNIEAGNYGTLVVRQDGAGGRTITFTAPPGFTLLRDSAVPDLQPAPSANAVTVYTWAFRNAQIQNILVVSKLVAVP